MFFKTLTLAFAFAASAYAAGTLEINTPGAAKQCVPTLLTFTGGQGPFELEILSGGQAIEIFAIPAGETSFEWPTNVPAGTSVDALVTDATGAVAQSALFTVQPGNDDCELV